MYQNEDQVDLDPVFLGMTTPSIVMGVPMEFFGINFIIFGIGMIGFASLVGKLIFFMMICIPLHVVAYIITEKDPHWMSVYLIKMTQCGPIQNRSFWKSNSYMP